MISYHNPVLLQTALNFLFIRPQKLYIDATIGGGGHAQAMLALGAKVLGLDQDQEAITYLSNHDAFQPALASGSLVLVRSNFSHTAKVARAHSWQPVSGILIDLGVSSHQLDSAHRGFSFQKSGALDMRMDQTLPNTAATLVNTLPGQLLAELFAKYGQIPTAQTLAHRIVAARPLTTTDQLASLTGKWSRQAFQSLRMAVNDELGSLETVLPQCLSLLEPGGRLVVISFNSLEDKLIKHAFSSWEATGHGSVLTPKPIVPTPSDIAANSRSTSAKLRAFSKN